MEARIKEVLERHSCSKHYISLRTAFCRANKSWLVGAWVGHLLQLDICPQLKEFSILLYSSWILYNVTCVMLTMVRSFITKFYMLFANVLNCIMEPFDYVTHHVSFNTGIFPSLFFHRFKIAFQCIGHFFLEITSSISQMKTHFTPSTFYHVIYSTWNQINRN